MSRILVNDSSPLRAPSEDERHAASGSKGIAHAMNGSGHHFAKTSFSKSTSPPGRRVLSPEMDRGTRFDSNPTGEGTSKLTSLAAKLNSRSAGALPPLSKMNATSSRDRSPSSGIEEVKGEDSSSSSSSKRFEASLQQYAYRDANSNNKRPSPNVIAIDDDDDDLSSLSSAGASLEPPKKKKGRFRLGSRPSSKRPDSDDDDVRLSTPPTSVATSSSIAGDRIDSEDLAKKVDSIVHLHPRWEKNRIRTELINNASQDGRVNVISAMEALKMHYISSSKGPVASANGAVPQQKATSYLLNKSGVRPPIGKGVQVTSRLASPSPGILPYKKIDGASMSSSSSFAPAKKDAPTSKAMERVKSTTTNSARSSISISDDDSDSGASSDSGYDRERKDEKKALQWFNEVDEKQLMDVIGVNADQAATILDLRPFPSVDDVTTKLGDKNAKGVTPKLFHNCVELMSGLQQVDGVLEKCEKMGNKLRKEVETWQNSSSSGFQDDDYLRGQPEGLSDGVMLKDFQLHGLNWLYLLYRKECSGILADDMGLGKTAQVIAFLNVVTARREKRPHLIVVPSSVLTNWMREFKVFGPGLQVYKYHGSQNERMEQRHILQRERQDVDVVITTYDMASGGERDHTFLKKYEFDACIYDEGHILKNQKSIKYMKLLKIRAKWRLLLTGTPLQNNLGELISLLKFIMPSYFRGAEEALGQIFKVNQQSQLSRERVNRAKKMMQPFLLRRKKVDVLLDLKPKTEKVKYCEMTKEQSKIYKEAYASSKAALRQQQREAAEALAMTRGKKAAAAAAATKTRSGHVLMELRKAANHPLLFRRLYTDAKIEALARDYLKNAEYADEDLTMKKEDFAINSDAELSMAVAAQYASCNKHMLAPKEWLNSGKIAALKEVIDEAAKVGERLIIFSQFVQTLEIICRALEVMDISYRGFTGSTTVDSRQEIVDEFTRDSSIRCFLLSTRAGGVGINLTAANWVVLFDQDFNPQNDRQAADRAYRMGQEKQVTIVRLISRGTIDEQIFELGKSKLELAERVEGAAVDDDAVEEEEEQELEAKVEQTLLAKLIQGDDEEGEGEGDAASSAE